MFAIQVLFALFIAIILTAVFHGIFRTTGPWRGFWAFFLIVFFAAVAAGLWIVPVGPSAWGYYWIPGFLAAIVFALLLAAATPHTPGTKFEKKARKAEKEITKTYTYNPAGQAGNPDDLYIGDRPVQGAVMGGFFWLLITLLVIIVVAGVIG